MRRMPSSEHRKKTLRLSPWLEGLESRQLLSSTAIRRAIATGAAASGAVAHSATRFAYTTPSGGRATRQIVGLGNLAGTSVDSSGALNLVYNGTNAYSKIVGRVNGGNGRAPLASILNGQLLAAGAQNSLSGVGGN